MIWQEQHSLFKRFPAVMIASAAASKSSASLYKDSPARVARAPRDSRSSKGTSTPASRKPLPGKLRRSRVASERSSAVIQSRLMWGRSFPGS